MQHFMKLYSIVWGSSLPFGEICDICKISEPKKKVKADKRRQKKR